MIRHPQQRDRVVDPDGELGVIGFVSTSVPGMVWVNYDHGGTEKWMTHELSPSTAPAPPPVAPWEVWTQ